MHHIISDGTSLGILTEELCKLYNGEKLKELEITYKDYAEYENKKIKTGELKEAEQYWLKQFKEEIPLLNIPTAYPRQNIQTFEGKKYIQK